MRAAGKYLFLLGLLVTSSVSAMNSGRYHAFEVTRAPNMDGMTGLLNMNLPHTMGAGLTAIGAVSQSQSLPGVYDDLTEAVAALRVGLSDNLELGLKTKSFSAKDLTGKTQSGLGDSEAMLKWRFREENEHLLAMALGLGAILPTGDENKGFREVENLGIKFSVSAAGENAVFDDSYIGLYFEAQAVAIDQMTSSSPYKEMYGEVNIGLAFPISDDNNLVFFTEYNQVVSKDIPTVERNHTTISPGLRYATDYFSLTVAAPMVDDKDTGTSQQQLVGLLSLGF